MDDKTPWWEAFRQPDPVIEDLWALSRPVEPEMRGPFPTGPAYYAGSTISMDIAFPSGLISFKPTAKVLLHPIVRNYHHIHAIEQRLGRIAVAHRGYVELVSV